MGKLKTTETFIAEAKLIHNNQYDYSMTEYKGNKTKVQIICPYHGLFEQSPHHHLNGIGCIKCGFQKTKDARKLPIETFTEKANQLHNDKYDYSKVNYVNTKTKVQIICPNHGLFEQTPNNHLSGKGCQQCKYENTGWNYHLWENAGKTSNNFDSFKLYIIECWNDTEKFYKIGITFNEVIKRFNTKTKMPYEWKVINIIESDNAREICELEHELQRKNKEYSYTPKIFFEGVHECFSKLIA